MRRVLSVLTLVVMIGFEVSAEQRVRAHTHSSSTRVSKWCSEDGSSQRYTTAALVPAGYSFCGELRTVALCDAEGRKYIGPAESAPFGYLDCARGPRIQLSRIGREAVPEKAVEKPSKASSSRTPKARSPRQDSEKDFLGVNEDQARSLEALKTLVPGRGAMIDSIVSGYLDYLRQLDELASSE